MQTVSIMWLVRLQAVLVDVHLSCHSFNAPTCNAARAGPAAEDSACLVISSSKGDASLGSCLLQVRRARKELEILREDLESREKRAAVRDARLQATDAEITSAHERALQ